MVMSIIVILTIIAVINFSYLRPFRIFFIPQIV